MLGHRRPTSETAYMALRWLAGRNVVSLVDRQFPAFSGIWFLALLIILIKRCRIGPLSQNTLDLRMALLHQV